MISLKVTPEKALQHLSLIPHKECQKGIQKHWHVDQEKFVKGKSVLWLFCWAKTGKTSDAARDEARNVFNEILTHDCFHEEATFFDWFDFRVAHDYARKYRYVPKRSLEEDLDTMLCPTLNT